jgi:hypothetical protein
VRATEQRSVVSYRADARRGINHQTASRPTLGSLAGGEPLPTSRAFLRTKTVQAGIRRLYFTMNVRAKAVRAIAVETAKQIKVKRLLRRLFFASSTGHTLSQSADPGEQPAIKTSRSRTDIFQSSSFVFKVVLLWRKLSQIVVGSVNGGPSSLSTIIVNARRRIKCEMLV